MSLFAPLLALILTDDPPLKKLDFLLGDWESKESATGADGTKVDFTLKGTNRWVLDGTYLRIEESFEIPGRGKQENLIMMTYDARDKAYRAWWYTKGAGKPIEFTGAFVEKDFQLTSEAKAPYPALRVTYKLVTDGRYDATLEVGNDGKWRVQTVAGYRRTKK
jgi:hypothetical protein